ncbi:Hypothetical protein, putative [Bodo saltans]|uniref:Uncharacterized protein n=1 Tax=Bodo saltans TaxID=75058 RepID=A0A0S4JTE3_BODSA|nr:Hypothetical protein, putative [Bodo saltans]|eukprot:CUG93499.1 Hypothetical protein, putative [Bodo saltans]
MDRNGKLPTKATLLAPMLQDVLNSMYESHTEMIRSEAKQVLMLSSFGSGEIGEDRVTLPQSIVVANGGGGCGAQSISATTSFEGPAEALPPVEDDDKAAAATTQMLKSPQSVGDASVSSFHSASTNPLSSPVPSSNSLFGGGAPAATTSSQPSGYASPAGRAALLGVTESDLMYSYRLFRHLIDAALQLKECLDIVSNGMIRKWIGPLRLFAPIDHAMALYVCTLVSNLSGFPESRVVLSSVAIELFDLVLKIAKSFVLERRVIHLALMTLSNLALCDAVHPTAEQCGLVVELVMPSYSEPQVVEAWCCTLCNMTAAHPTLVKEFTRLGVVEVLHRLLLFLGDDPRVVTRGLQCLSNLSCPATD